MPVRRMQYFHVEENQACCIGDRDAHSAQWRCYGVSMLINAPYSNYRDFVVL